MDKYITYETRKGYPISSGYKGYITEGGKKILFATEEEYNEYIEELDKKRAETEESN